MRFLVFTFLFSCQVHIWAQQNINPVDPAATQILDLMKLKFESAKDVSIDFSLEMIYPGHAAETQTGKLIKKDELIKFSVVDFQDVYFNKNGIWVHIIQDEIVQIHDRDMDMDGEYMTPDDLMTMYDSGAFSYAITNELMSSDGNVAQIDFKAIDNDFEYSKMKMDINTDTNTLKSALLISRDGSRFILNVNDINFDQNISNEVFIFNEVDNPSIEVEDLRF